ncbi:MAG: DUF1192 domain-containing protein [Pseudomonadota bacterium]
MDDAQEELDAPIDRLVKEDLYTFSVGDLEGRIATLRDEIVRCEAALSARGGAKAAADALFKS